MKLPQLKKKYDTVWLGMIIGAILPPVGFVISKIVKCPACNYDSYWKLFIDSTLEVNKEILIFSMLPSMLAFYFLFFLFKFDRAAKGLVGVTLILAALGFLLMT